MDEHEFKQRTKQIGLRVIRVVENLSPSKASDVIGRQLIRCATSVGANYRAACRARSSADMIAKLAIVEEEPDETLYWLEMLVEAELMPEARLSDLMSDVQQILSMTVASIRTLTNRTNK